MVLKLGFVYFALIAWGCLTLLPLVALREVGQGFYRFFGFVCVILQTLAIGFLLMAGSILKAPYQKAGVMLGLSLFFTLSFTVALRIRRPWFLWSSFGVALTSGLIAIAYVPWAGQKTWVLFAFHSILSALTMGACLLAMILGHWYLITPKLSIAPLRRYSNSYIFFLALTTLELIFNYAFYVGGGPGPITQAGQDLLADEKFFMGLRVGAGILAPLGLSYWIWKTVKMKSTQSATGILYAAVVCTLLGEGMGLYLTLTTGMPF